MIDVFHGMARYQNMADYALLIDMGRIPCLTVRKLLQIFNKMLTLNRSKEMRKNVFRFSSQGTASQACEYYARNNATPGKPFKDAFCRFG